MRFLGKHCLNEAATACLQEDAAGLSAQSKAAECYLTVCQGFSADWWKTKHNTHHAAPNELDHDCKAAVDPDIDTLPLIAWSVEMLESLPNATHRMLIKAQHYFFFPILLFARLSWFQQSVAHAYSLSKVNTHSFGGVTLRAALHNQASP